MCADEHFSYHSEGHQRLSYLCHHWSVKLDVRDVGGHLDISLRNGASTCPARVREVLGSIVVVGVCLWGFV